MTISRPFRLPLVMLCLAAAGACGRTEPARPTAPPGPELPAVPALIARAKALEIDTPYVPPPGDPLELDAAGFATVMCSAVFVTGLDPDFAAENVGFFTGPVDSRAKLEKPLVDRQHKAVRVRLPDGTVREARHYGSQGCVTLPKGEETIHFTPVHVTSALPDPATTPWPMGDAKSRAPLPPGLDAAKVQSALDAAFNPASEMTAAFVATWKGHIIAERYGDKITARTPLESWSLGKSITATLMGMLIKDGVYALEQPAPVPEWQTTGDPRAKIRIADLLNMSGGLRIKAHLDPDFDPKGTYPDHLYYYTGAIDMFRYAATRPVQWPPGQVGRYRNTDPVLVNYLIRLAVEKRGENYLTHPQRALFDRLGIRSAIIEPDVYGNLVMQGYDYLSARDWVRLGNLYLQDGVWQGERLLPEGFVKFVSTVAPAWAMDRRPIYGGFFWINGDSGYPIPTDAYFMAGSGGQNVFIIPSHDLVVARLGHYKGSLAGNTSVKKALTLLMQATPLRN
jgi:CubicO group peptidase (beta-lactamase class C family)